MIYSSLAVLALSASAMASPLTSLVHLHPRPAQPDTRVSVELYNNGVSFHDVRIGGQTYTIKPHESLSIKAPAGTVVYADSRTPEFRRGDVILDVEPAIDNQKVKFN